MKMLINSCISEVDRIGVRKSRKSSAVWPQEEGRHAMSKFRRAVIMKERKLLKLFPFCRVSSEEVKKMLFLL